MKSLPRKYGGIPEAFASLRPEQREVGKGREGRIPERPPMFQI